MQLAGLFQVAGKEGVGQVATAFGMMLASTEMTVPVD